MTWQHAHIPYFYLIAAVASSWHHAVTHIVTSTMHQQPVNVTSPMCVLLRQAVDLILTCRDKFAEFSYLRSADKKHGVPEHLEKTVLFLLDASPVAKADADAQDWDAQASSAKAAEEDAAAAVKAAWHAAKEAKEVLESSCHLWCTFFCPWSLNSLSFSHFTCSTMRVVCRAALQQACFRHATVSSHLVIKLSWLLLVMLCSRCFLYSCAVAWHVTGPKQQQCNSTCLFSAWLLACNPLRRRSNVYRPKCI